MLRVSFTACLAGCSTLECLREASSIVRESWTLATGDYNCFYMVRVKNSGVATTWGNKLRSALRPSGWMLTEGGRLLGNGAAEVEEDSSYDTGVDLTEVDFIPDDIDAEQDPPSRLQ